MIFPCHITGGLLTIQNRQRFLNEVAALKDGLYELTLKKKARRSNQQNRYYWGVIIFEINHRLKQLGNDFDADTVHEFLKDKFNSVPVIGPGGELIGTVGGSTAKLNKEDFGIYIDTIIAWCASFLSITIPLPGEQSEMFL